MAGTRGGFAKRGSFSKGGSGHKKGFTSKKRSSPDDDEPAPRSSKKAKTGDDEDEEGEAGGSLLLAPKFEDDDDGNRYIPLNARGTRRANVTDFKGKHFVNIREYWENPEGKILPGKKGISLSIEQYNTLLAAMPLIELLLAEKGEKAMRPEYSDAPAANTPVDEEEAQEEKGEVGGVGDDEEEEE